MFIGVVKTQDNEFRLETDTFEKAWGFLHQQATETPNIIQAIVLEDVKWSDGHYLHPYKEVASMRVVR